MAVNRRKKTTGGWGNVAPQTRYEKRRIAERCGLKAFLKPDRSDPGKSSFPVISKYSHKCQVDCQGLRAALSRAEQFGHRSVARKARRLGRKARCDWAV